MKLFQVSTMYNAVLTVIIWKPGDCVYWMDKHGLGKDFGKMYDAEAAFLDRDLLYVVWMPKWDEATFVHEASHFAVHVVRKHLSIKRLRAADEPVARMVEDVFRKTQRKVKGR